jgi:hypothetical protein
MKRLTIYILSICGLFYACSPTDSKSVEQISDLEKVTTYAFSDTLELDTFKVAIVGNSTKDMQMLFTIKSYRGEEIYRQEIKTAELLKNYLASAELKKEKDKIQFLKDELDYFFDERHFLEPAVTENEQADKNVPDKSFYEELKKTGHNGFDYRLGKDKIVYIAWSTKEQKVKVYYQCC